VASTICSAQRRDSSSAALPGTNQQPNAHIITVAVDFTSKGEANADATGVPTPPPGTPLPFNSCQQTELTGIDLSRRQWLTKPLAALTLAPTHRSWPLHAGGATGPREPVREG